MAGTLGLDYWDYKNKNNMKYLLLILTLFSYNSFAQKTINNIYTSNYQVEFLRTGIDGTTLFKIYSYGKNTNQAIENAKADAIKAILFKGIPGSDVAYPLISPQSIIEKHSPFLGSFFESKKYLDFITIANDGSISGEDRIKVGNKYKIGLIVSINKNRLREYLQNEKIIDKLSQGF
jgi:hypothetical protein